MQNSSCTSSTAAAMVRNLCVGQKSCSVSATNTVFGGDPCHLTVKHASIQVTCAASSPVSEPVPTIRAWRVRYAWDDAASTFSRYGASCDLI